MNKNPQEIIPKRFQNGSRIEQIIYQGVKDRERGNGPDISFIHNALSKKEQEIYMKYYDSTCIISNDESLVSFNTIEDESKALEHPEFNLD